MVVLINKFSSDHEGLAHLLWGTIFVSFEKCKQLIRVWMLFYPECENKSFHLLFDLLKRHYFETEPDQDLEFDCRNILTTWKRATRMLQLPRKWPDATKTAIFNVTLACLHLTKAEFWEYSEVDFVHLSSGQVEVKTNIQQILTILLIRICEFSGF